LHEYRIIRIDIPPYSLEISEPMIGQKSKVLAHMTSKQAESIEILTVQSGMSFADCYKNRLMAKLDGFEIKIVSLSDLKRIKKVGAREQDFDDIANLS
jgi:hypothetical protein